MKMAVSGSNLVLRRGSSVGVIGERAKEITKTKKSEFFRYVGLIKKLVFLIVLHTQFSKVKRLGKVTLYYFSILCTFIL